MASGNLAINFSHHLCPVFGWVAVALKRQEQRTQIEERESAKQELSQYLYATHLDGALLVESMYQAIARVKIFCNEHIEIQWKFEDLFTGQGYGERKAV